MRIYLTQLGCRLNYGENAALAARLAAAGHRLTATPEAARVIVVNTCAVTAEAARKTRQLLRRLHRTNPAARLVVSGCWAELERDAASALPGVAAVLGNRDKERLPELLDEWRAVPAEEKGTGADTGKAGDAAAFAAEARRWGRTRAFVKVQDGCDNRCSYCVVRTARGPARSRPAAAVAAEVRRLVAAGFRETVLTGVHLSSYAKDLDDGTDLKKLVETVLKETSVERLRLGSLEPWDLDAAFLTWWGKHAARLCPHLHLPLQAGTDKQLRAMARPYNTADYRRLVETAREALPDLTLTTDLIAGFPGETDADFAAGAAFVEELRFTHAHVFPYSKRPGTPAAVFSGQVPDGVKKERARRLRELAARTGETERRRFLHTVRPVLWEKPRLPGPARSEDDKPADSVWWSGLTDNYLRVCAAAPPDADLTGRVTPVCLNELRGRVFFSTINEVGFIPTAVNELARLQPPKENL